MLAIDYLERTAAKFGDKVVIREPGRELTYRELVVRARNVGYSLSQKLGGKRNIPVGIFIDKGCDCLTAIFGILYSGNCYVPMDVKTPGERLKSILQTMDSDVLLVTEQTAEKLVQNQVSCSMFNLQGLASCPPDEQESRDDVLQSIRRGIVDTELMYILFTSGSTGAPKGVAITHRSVEDYIQAFTSTVPICSNDIIGNQVPFYVDMSLKDIYMTVAIGATVVVIPQTYFMSPKKLLLWLEENKVTMLMWVPTAYSIVSRFDGLSRVRPASLKKFLFSGEGMPISVYRYWLSYYPEAEWIQQYGPTEITGACTTFSVDRVYEEGETIPIGRPFPNTGIFLLTEQNEAVPETVPDVIGEICVYGTCLAAGYFNNPQKTAEAFVQNPLIRAYPSRMYRTGDLGKWDENGNLVFVSRKDFQIKHGGRRIELGEIEAAVDAVPAIKAGCCIHDAKTDTIVLCYVGETTEAEIRGELKNRLPSYMIPGRYIRLDSLPQLPNGKLDRKTLQTLAQKD